MFRDDTPAAPAIARLRERRSAKWSTFAPDVLPAHVAELDLAVAGPVKDALRAAVDRDDFGYAGDDHSALDAAFARFARRRLGWEVDPEQVTLVPDVMIGIGELLRVLTEPGDGVVITPPVYPPFFHTIAEVERRIVEVPVAADRRLDLDGIERALAAGARTVLLSNPHNPLGRVVTREELLAVADLADRHDAWVISDEIWAPLVLGGERHVPYLMVSEQAAERGIALTAASKAFNLAGLKAGVAVTASANARRAVARLPHELHYRAGLLGVIASEAAFDHGDAWLDELLEHLDGQRRRLGRLLADRLPDVRWTPPQAGYLAWLDCRALGLGDDPGERFLEDGRVALSRGLDFGAPGAGHMRLNFGTTAAILEEIVERLVITASEAGTPSARRSA